MLGYGVHQDDELVSHVHREPTDQTREEAAAEALTEMPSSVHGEAMSTTSNPSGSAEPIKKESKVRYLFVYRRTHNLQKMLGSLKQRILSYLYKKGCENNDPRFGFFIQLVVNLVQRDCLVSQAL